MTKFFLNIRVYSLLFILGLAACPPAIDNPEKFNNGTLAFSYPGNWTLNDNGEIITIQEKLFLGNIDGNTHLIFDPSQEKNVSSSSSIQQRVVERKIGDSMARGLLEFEWTKGRITSHYALVKEEHILNITISSHESSIEKAEPGIRLILESLKF